MSTPRAGNVIQLVVAIVAFISLFVYFVPEQQYKKTEDDRIAAQKKVDALNNELENLASERTAVQSQLTNAKQQLSDTRTQLDRLTVTNNAAAAAAKSAENERNAMQLRLAEIREELDRSSRSLGALEMELQKTRSAIAVANSDLLQARTRVVRLLQDNRARVLPSLAGYVGVVCKTQMQRGELAACAVGTLQSGEFAELLAARELRDLLRDLPMLSAGITGKWQALRTDVERRQRDLIASCESSPAATQDGCRAEMTGRGLSLAERLLGVYAAQAFITTELGSWVESKLQKPSCPTLVAGKVVDDHWPADCR